MSTRKLDQPGDEYLQKLIRKQLALSCKLFLVFIVILFGMPLMNFFAPKLMNIRVFGFTVTWLLLAVLIYPVTWLISWVYIRYSLALDEEALSWTYSQTEKPGDSERRRTT